MISALLFDLDGTLADSLNVMRNTFRAFLQAHGGCFSEEEFDRFNGPKLLDIVSQLRQDLNIKTPINSLLNEYNRMLDEAYTKVPLNPGVMELLKTAAAEHYRIVIVTSNSSHRTNAWTTAVGISKLIDTMICAEDVSQGKPYPEPYLQALKAINLEPKHAIAIEDSLQGASAAIAAKLRTFGYQPQNRPPQLWPDNIEVFSDFGKLSHIIFE